MPKPNLKAVIYCRVSSQEQVNGTSLERQKDACLEYTQNKLNLNENQVRVFIEKGESATAANRTELIKALRFCSENKKQIEFFIVWKIDRFARNTTDHYALRKMLTDYGVSLHSVTEPINNNDPMAKMMESVLAGYSQFENDIRKIRCEGGMQRKIQEGIWPWHPPIGYMHSKGPRDKRKNLPDQVDPDRFYTIQRGFREFLKGETTITRLADLYSDWGLKTKDGKSIKKQKVDWMLQNKYYAGILVDPWGGQEYSGQHQSMITKDEFDKIQQIKKSRSNLANIPHMRLHPDFPLRRFVRCAHCGNKLTGAWRLGRSKKYAYYNCRDSNCKMFGLSIPKNELENNFFQFLKSFSPAQEFIKLFEKIILDVWNDKHQIVRQQKEIYEQNLKLLEAKKGRLTEMRINGELSEEDYIKYKYNIENQIIGLQVSKNEASIEELDLESTISYCRQFLRDTASIWRDMSNPEHKQRLQSLVFPKGVSYDRDGSAFSTAEISIIFALNKEFSGKTNKTHDSESHLVAGVGFEPTTSRLWASRAARLLYPAIYSK
jgi:site-specific DNA recombinase